MQKFRILGLSESTLAALAKKGFETPTDIQEQVIPLLLKGKRDIIGQAQTGTGKTAAFGLPLIEILKPNQDFVQCLILTPTRELALQVSQELNSYRGESPLKIVPIYGGQSLEEQIRQLRRGVDIVVGTPGRVLDHMKRRTLKLGSISHLVLDEADEMLNMGFIEDIKTILEQSNPKKRMLLFSATMPNRLLTIAQQHMGERDIVTVKKEQLTTALTEQIYFEVHSSEKFEALVRVIDAAEAFYGLIFCRTKLETERVTKKLLERSYQADYLHGDVPQRKREKILEKFKQRRSNILVATDVAARGIDISNLTYVVNFSLPEDAESYVHRIGRTGRAGNKGRAVTFVTPDQMRLFYHIKKVSNTPIKKESLPSAVDINERKKVRIKEKVEGLLLQKRNETAGCTELAFDLLKKYDAQSIVKTLLTSLYGKDLEGNIGLFKSNAQD